MQVKSVEYCKKFSGPEEARTRQVVDQLRECVH